jgi:nucleoid DNA-binding protein/DNA-directed RNA polymerase subunit RPC12/RpoP
MAESYTKAKLIAELAATTTVSKAAIGRLLDKYTEIAYREAPNGFVVPGVCKLKVVKKKACKRRNPITGQVFLIGERDALKVVPLKKAKTAIVPNKNVVIQRLEEPAPEVEVLVEPEVAPPATTLAPAGEGAAGAAPAAAAGSVREAVPSLPAAHEEGQVVFPCSECGSMLSAPPSMAGQMGECPFCGAGTPIPNRQPEAVKPEHQTVGAPSAASVSDFILFVCRACGQEIEAPADMVGMNVECPTCATSLTVPISGGGKAPGQTQEIATESEPQKTRSSMTIRIDLSDLE